MCFSHEMQAEQVSCLNCGIQVNGAIYILMNLVHTFLLPMNKGLCVYTMMTFQDVLKYKHTTWNIVLDLIWLQLRSCCGAINWWQVVWSSDLGGHRAGFYGSLVSVNINWTFILFAETSDASVQFRHQIVLTRRKKFSLKH